MAATIYPTVPVAQPEAEPWPPLFDDGDEHSIRVDEMFARQLDTEFSAGVRDLLHDPETGLSALKGEVALEAIAGAMPALDELKQRTLSQAIGPRQRSLLEPMIDTRLDWAAGTIGQLAHRATVEVDDQSVAECLAGLNQDAAMAWQDPAHLRKLGRTVVNELHYQGERRGRDAAETDARVRAGLSDLYAGAVEAAIGQDDLDGAAALYDHARVVIDPDRQTAIDRRFAQARETALYREVDRDLAGLPLDPAGPPGLDIFERRAAELAPEDASAAVRAGIAQVADHAHRYAERQWHRGQADAGLAALDWFRRNHEGSFLAIPMEVRDWLAPDQRQGLETLFIEGRLKTDGALFERLDRQMVHEPDNFAALDLDRHRLSLGDADYTRFAAAQKAIAEGRIDPDLARYDRLRLGIDGALGAMGVDTDSPVATKIRAAARDQLESFEVIEGRPPTGKDIDSIIEEEIARRRPEPTSNLVPSSADPVEPEVPPADAYPGEAPSPRPDVPEVIRFDDGTKLVTRRAVESGRGKADVSEAYDEKDRIVSATSTFADGHRVHSRWSYPGETHWSQVDTVRGPEGKVLGTVTTTFDGERVKRIAEPTDWPSQTDIWDRDGPVATAQNVAAPALAIPFLLDLVAAAIGAVFVGKAIDDTINRPGTSGTFGASEMARPPGERPGKGHNNPPEPVDDDKRPPSGPPVPPFPPGQRPSWRQSELDDAADLQPNFEPQVAFKNGQEVSSSTPGSRRPDGVSKDRRSASFETKNYNVNAYADRLVSNVIEQLLDRAQHLPPGMQQNIRVDVRGQQVSEEQLNEVARRIVERSNGLLRREHIQFRRKD